MECSVHGCSTMYRDEMCCSWVHCCVSNGRFHALSGPVVPEVRACDPALHVWKLAH